LTANINRTVLHPTPILPIYAPRRSVTLLRDRIIKTNLAQKASFKCKSPPPYRPDSSISRSTTAMLTSSQLQMKISNPLKVFDFKLIYLIGFFLILITDGCEFVTQ
jgi:hypothetical protein